MNLSVIGVFSSTRLFAVVYALDIAQVHEPICCFFECTISLHSIQNSNNIFIKLIQISTNGNNVGNWTVRDMNFHS